MSAAVLWFSFIAMSACSSFQNNLLCSKGKLGGNFDIIVKQGLRKDERGLQSVLSPYSLLSHTTSFWKKLSARKCSTEFKAESILILRKISFLSKAVGVKHKFTRGFVNKFIGWKVLQVSVYFTQQNWLAFAKLHKPLFNEHGVIDFPNTNPPTDENNNAYCKVGKT